MKTKLLPLIAALVMASPFANAWEPSGDITMIVAYKAGSGTDTGARLLAAEASKVMGHTIVVQNLPGADGKIGWTKLVRAKPDGQTIGFINLPTFTTLATAPGATFSTDDVVPLANHLLETAVVVVPVDSPYKTLKDLVAAAKANPDIKAGTNGIKASNHIGAQLLANSAGFEYKAVPYGGTANQLLALRQHEVDFAVVKVGDIAKSIEGKDAVYRVLGIFAPKRTKDLPNVPTLAELGYYPNWYGSARAIVAPKGTPKEIVDYYVKAFDKTMHSPEAKAEHDRAGLSIDYMNNEELGQLIKQQEKFSREEVPAVFK